MCKFRLQDRRCSGQYVSSLLRHFERQRLVIQSARFARGDRHGDWHRVCSAQQQRDAITARPAQTDHISERDRCSRVETLKHRAAQANRLTIGRIRQESAQRRAKQLGKQRRRQRRAVKRQRDSESAEIGRSSTQRDIAIPTMLQRGTLSCSRSRSSEQRKSRICPTHLSTDTADPDLRFTSVLKLQCAKVKHRSQRQRWMLTVFHLSDSVLPQMRLSERFQ